MTLLHKQIATNLNKDTDKVKEALDLIAKEGDVITLVLLSAPSVTTFTVADLVADLEEEGEDEDLLEMLADIEAKSSTDRLVYVIDKDINTHKFVL